MLYMGGGGARFESKTLCHRCIMGRSVKKHHSGRLRYHQDRRSHQEGQNSFLSFFYFVLFVLNCEPCKKWFPQAKQWYLLTPFREMNYGPREVCVFHFVILPSVLFCWVKSWKNDIFYEKFCLVLIFGWVLRENYGLYLVFFVIRIKISIHVIIDFTFINLLQLKNS